MNQTVEGRIPVLDVGPMLEGVPGAMDALAASILDRAEHGVGRGGIAGVVDHHRVAILCQPLRHGGADAAGGARHDGNFSILLAHGSASILA